MTLAMETLITPALDPPEGVKSNYVNPDSHLLWFIATTAVCMTISTVALILRLITKLYVVKSVGWDDCLSCSRYTA